MKRRCRIQSWMVLRSVTRVAGRADDAVAEDLADRAGRRQHRLRAVGQGPSCVRRLMTHLRGLLVGDVVGELHLHVGQAEQRDGADRLDVGHAGHLDLDRHGDVALDLLRRLAGILGDDVDQRRHRVGIGLDVERLVGEQAADHQRDAEDDHEDALLQGGGDDGMHGERCSADAACGRRSVAPGGAVDEQRAARHHRLADAEALAHLDQAVGRGADLDRRATRRLLSGRATQTRAWAPS